MRISKKTELLKQIWDLLPEDGKSFCGYAKEKYMGFPDFVMKHYKFSRLEQLKSDLEFIKSSVTPKETAKQAALKDMTQYAKDHKEPNKEVETPVAYI